MIVIKMLITIVLFKTIDAIIYNLFCCLSKSEMYLIRETNGNLQFVLNLAYLLKYTIKCERLVIRSAAILPILRFTVSLNWHFLSLLYLQI